MPNYKLVYFNVRGRGELPRLLFAQAGEKYEDCRVEFSDWQKLKPTTPLGTLPYLVVDGESIPQTMTIVRLLATRFGLMGKNDIENARIDSVLDACADFLAAMAGAVYEKNEDVKKTKLEKVEKETRPTTLNYLESIIKANSKSEWTVGDKITVADLAIYDYFYNSLQQDSKVLDSYPAVQRIRGKVAALPNIAKWVKSRPESQF